MANADAVKRTNPTKVLFPDDGITKQEIHEYLLMVAPYALPHLRGRPIVVQRWPNGIAAPAWFQHRAPKSVPDFVRTVEVIGEDGPRSHVVVDDEATLVWLGQLAALTIHQWGSHVPEGVTEPRAVLRALAHPDYVVFDLDPGDGTFADLVEVAFTVKAKLDAHALESIVKTSGKRGLHVVVPIARTHDWDEASSFAMAIANEVVAAAPKLATVERTKSKRGGRLYLDVVQNGPGRTIVAPYTIRALRGAPISTPIAWDEVTARLDPSSFTLRTMPERLEKVGDLWRPVLGAKQTLPKLAHAG